MTDRLTDEALGFIDRNKDGPFFLYLAHFAVHDPIHGRPDLVEKYEAKLKADPPKGDTPYSLEGNPDLKEPLSREYLDKAINDPAFCGIWRPASTNREDKAVFRIIRNSQEWWKRSTKALGEYSSAWRNSVSTTTQ